eukprot:TRINITY_DN8727_c0_g1_i1.p1 TRINITY_DN8727_c0_g1~~TRINITY_DN8727_c0_g1_i1.p1  ORF type:complete len:705 (-),score=134.92 TRINITY_DN8727_c0_g1_i1:856-2970(-)
MGCGSSSLKDTNVPDRVLPKLDSISTNGGAAIEEDPGGSLPRDVSKSSAKPNSVNSVPGVVPERSEGVGAAEDTELDRRRTASGLEAKPAGDVSEEACAPEAASRSNSSAGPADEAIPKGSPATRDVESGRDGEAGEPTIAAADSENGRPPDGAPGSSLDIGALSFPSPPNALSFPSPPADNIFSKPQPMPRSRPHSAAMPSLDENGFPMGPVQPPPPKPPVEVREFTWRELVKATDGFNTENIVSEGGRQAANIVFRGKLSSGKLVSVCKLSKREWQDEEHFVAEAKAVAHVRRMRGVATLQGFCTENGARMLVADFMPTLARRLFHYEVDAMPWAERIRVAISILRTLQLLCSQHFYFYHEVNVYTVLYDKNSEPWLSCFGLLQRQSAPLPPARASVSPPRPDAKSKPTVTPASLVHSFGMLLQALLTGQTLTSSKFLELVRDEATVREVVDSTFQQDTAEFNRAQALIPAVVSCLREKPEDRPSIEQLLVTLKGIQDMGREPQARARMPDVFARSPDWTGSEEPGLSRLWQAARDCDLLTLHNHLVEEPRDYTPPAEPSFESWNPVLQEKVRAHKLGDRAFKAKEWEEAIKKYDLYRELDYVKMPIMFARRCLCYLHIQKYELALRDAMTANFEDATWPEALYLQAAAARLMNLEEDADLLLKEASKIEEDKMMELQSRSRNASPSSVNGDFYRRRSREGE